MGYLQIEGQMCLVGSVDQGLIKNKQINMLDRMTKKRAGKEYQSFFPHSHVTQNLLF